VRQINDHEMILSCETDIYHLSTISSQLTSFVSKVHSFIFDSSSTISIGLVDDDELVDDEVVDDDV